MFHGLELLAPKKYEIDLSNEVINFDFGQGAAKISKVKVGGRKKYLPTRPGSNNCAWGQPSWQIFIQAPTLTFDIFAAP